MTGIEHDPEYRGIMPRAFVDMFDLTSALVNQDSRIKIVLRASYIEIYNEEIRDLLS